MVYTKTTQCLYVKVVNKYDKIPRECILMPPQLTNDVVLTNIKFELLCVFSLCFFVKDECTACPSSYTYAQISFKIRN